MVTDIKSGNLPNFSDKLANDDGRIRLEPYECIHEKLSKGFFQKYFKKDPTTVRQEQIKKRQEQTSPLQSSPRKTEIKYRKPMRIAFNFDNIYEDPHACYEYGQKIILIESDELHVPSSRCTYNKSCEYTCKTSDLITTEVQLFFTNYITPTLREIVASYILVDPEEPNLILDAGSYNKTNGTCLTHVIIPEYYITHGIDQADLVIFVTIRPPTEKNIVAHSVPCNFRDYGTHYSRPLAASINFNPSFFTQFIYDPHDLTYEEYIKVSLHELTHSLGFSSMFLSSFINEDGHPYDASIEVQRSGVTPNGEPYNYYKRAINSPNVKKVIRNHFDCKSLEYAELEDSGGYLDWESHWEKRVVGEEFMVAWASPIMPVTRLTLALLKDTGWYDIDLTKAEKWVFGKNLGCDMLKQCYNNTWNYQGYFCSRGGQPGCTCTRMGKGVCRLAVLNNLEPQYQHFVNTSLGGTDGVFDFCPTYLTSYPARGNSRYCIDNSLYSNLDAQYHELYSMNSRCFEFVSPNNSVGQACWEMK
ncbi:hypothetical protein SAMD00019534_028800 [Acytostelium subglobosum LB1]|uniref:hypothetical protein n=1 Tax=Acytostelium subglobosum LB1 TaxID=1410327 RepID=UPI000644A235|nr:hypothetical protein SAMD00019534_028800 [Acytostelium subglobosum LB1]GAM19705.1 hypothetical protein SAMD00019534_028800 [Acytostelium subglobosum LB1]|eukprot:XP_012756467.1 hypothetical protein SAMD00019534_028800 [Acytostelium subglobosum LB1]